MPTWGEILQELKGLQSAGGRLPGGWNAFDFVRRKYLKAVAAQTGRNVILYSTRWVQPQHDVAQTSITPEDVHGFMEVVHGLNGDALDLILHSPGGSAEATEAVVLFLRSKFEDIRVFVPHAAMSSATMLCCAADRIVMGAHSFLGPVDPQVLWRTGGGQTFIPAHAVLEQFERAKRECRDPSLLPVWAPILQLYGPALIAQCERALELSKALVTRWLTDYMFENLEDAGERAKGTADALSSKEALSHGRFLHRDELRSKTGLVIDDLEADQALQDAILSVYHATSHTFGATPAQKIIENHLGSAFVKIARAMARCKCPWPSPHPPPDRPGRGARRKFPSGNPSRRRDGSFRRLSRAANHLN